MAGNWVEEAMVAQAHTKGSKRTAPSQIIVTPPPPSHPVRPVRPRRKQVGSSRRWQLALLLSLVTAVAAAMPPPPVAAASWLPLERFQEPEPWYAVHKAGMERLPVGIREVRVLSGVAVATASPRWDTLTEAERGERLKQLLAGLKGVSDAIVFHPTGRPAGQIRAGAVEVYP